MKNINLTIIAGIATSVLLSGCGKSPPPCDSSEATKTVLEIILPKLRLKVSSQLTGKSFESNKEAIAFLESLGEIKDVATAKKQLSEASKALQAREYGTSSPELEALLDAASNELDKAETASKLKAYIESGILEDSNVGLDTIRTESTDEKLLKTQCVANFSSKVTGLNPIPVTYRLSFTSEDKLYVEVSF